MYFINILVVINSQTFPLRSIAGLSRHVNPLHLSQSWALLLILADDLIFLKVSVKQRFLKLDGSTFFVCLYCIFFSLHEIAKLFLQIQA